MATGQDYANEIKTTLEAQRAQIAQQTTLQASLIELFNGQKANIATLEQRILDLQIDPAVADAIRALFAANAAATQENINGLLAAIPANTPAEPTEPPVEGVRHRR